MFKDRKHRLSVTGIRNHIFARCFIFMQMSNTDRFSLRPFQRLDELHMPWYDLQNSNLPSRNLVLVLPGISQNYQRDWMTLNKYNSDTLILLNQAFVIQFLQHFTWGIIRIIETLPLKDATLISSNQWPPALRNI